MGLLCSFLSDAEFSRTFLSDLLQARDSGSLTDAECEPVCVRLRLHKLCFLQVTEFDFFFFLNQPKRHSAMHLCDCFTHTHSFRPCNPRGGLVRGLFPFTDWKTGA